MWHQVKNRGVVRVSVALVLAAVGAAPLADAKPNRSPAAAPAAEGAMTAASLAKLKSADLAIVREGLDDARLAGKRAAPAVPAIVALLTNGVPYAVAEAALDTLGDIESPDASPTIAMYARHRDPTLRRAAVRALAKTQGPMAAPTVRAALSDPDSRVRAEAATGLGALKAKAAVGDLFLALDHRVYEAAVSIGQLCEGAECDTFMSRLGKVPFDVMTTGIDPILFRPASEVGDEAKIAIVDKVRDVGTREANGFLKQIGARWPKKGSAKVKGEIDAAVLATLSSPGGPP
jgi:hypothetical protein